MSLRSTPAPLLIDVICTGERIAPALVTAPNDANVYLHPLPILNIHLGPVVDFGFDLFDFDTFGLDSDSAHRLACDFNFATGQSSYLKKLAPTVRGLIISRPAVPVRACLRHLLYRRLRSSKIFSHPRCLHHPSS
ncbi:hypothetical protein EVAR_69464_1 [Eumeta japonica]|uniref:Uncharacterized protein n=1 Tax=Eumeta variegata TaxID=151549 RepID=A0A4C1SBK8_EUMVA|nr:hypothetical protein EVAR_69464_1 [Eumeta japonica]